MFVPRQFVESSRPDFCSLYSFNKPRKKKARLTGTAAIDAAPLGSANTLKSGVRFGAGSTIFARVLVTVAIFCNRSVLKNDEPVCWYGICKT